MPTDMSTSGILMEQILAIFIILIIGVICYKAKLIDDTTNRKLSNILLTLVHPILIFTSFNRKFEIDLVKGLIISLILAVVNHLFAIAMSYILIRRKKRKIIVVDGVRTVTYVDNEDVEVERLQSSYSNMGFMGIPLVNGIFGSEGVFYVTASVMMFNILMWTHGVTMISGSKELRFKDIIKRLSSPAIVAIILGIIFFVFQIKLPLVLNQSLNYVGSINTPLGMLIAGATVAKTDFKKLLTNNPRKYYMVFVKLMLIPLLLLPIYVRLPIDKTVKLITIIMSAMPTATIGTLLTIRYKRNSVLAAEIFAITTLLCVLTIPFIIYIAELLM